MAALETLEIAFIADAAGALSGIESLSGALSSFQITAQGALTDLTDAFSSLGGAGNNAGQALGQGLADGLLSQLSAVRAAALALSQAASVTGSVTIQPVSQPAAALPPARLGDTPSASSATTVRLEVDGRVLGQAAIDGINRIGRTMGRVMLEM